MGRQSFALEEFSHGLDLVSSLNAIPPGFTPNAKNFRISEYGGIEKVKGYSAFATVTANASELAFYAKKDGSSKALIAACGTKWQSINAAGTAADIHSALTADDNTTFAVHADKLYGLSPSNNIAVWPGSGIATAYAPGVNTGPPRGIILGIWDARMFVAVASSGNLGMTVQWSEPFDATNGFVNTTGLWPAANNVDLGGTGTSSDHIVGGMVTPDGLVVFTTGSTYLMYDSTDGFNSVVDAEHGCSSRRSLARIGNTIYGVNANGVFATDGRAPLEIVSRRVDPLFQSESPDLSTAAGCRSFRSYLMSYARSATTNLMLDIFPEGGSIMAHDYPAYAFANGPLSAAAGEEVYFIDASDRTKIRKAFSGGSFAGADIACHYDTPYMDLGDDSVLKRLRRVRMVGRGDLYLTARTDYATESASVQRLGFPTLGTAGAWGSAVWDTSVSGGYDLYEGFADAAARGRRIQFSIAETSSATYPLRNAIGVDPSGSLGGCGVYLLEPQYTTSTRRR